MKQETALRACEQAAELMSHLFDDKVKAASSGEAGSDTFVDSPKKLLKSAKGVVILKVNKLGVGVSVKLNSVGVLVARRADGTWSTPCCISTGAFGFGFLIGREQVVLVLILRSQHAVDLFASGKSVILNETLTVSNYSSSDASFHCWSGGAFVGLAISSRLVLKVSNKLNRILYQKQVSIEDILQGNVTNTTPELNAVGNVLAKFSSNDSQSSLSIPKEGNASSSSVAKPTAAALATTTTEALHDESISESTVDSTAESASGVSSKSTKPSKSTKLTKSQSKKHKQVRQEEFPKLANEPKIENEVSVNA